MMNKPILLVEDEEADVIFMRYAMEWAKVPNPLVIARDGREAVDFIEARGEHQHRLGPALVLLDLKLPFIPGLEVLKHIRQHPETSRVPVIVFSSSNQDQDVEAAYSLGADAYVVKPAYNELLEVVRRVKLYWLDRPHPPPDCADWDAVRVPPPGQS